ncbi:hypothetical protein B0H16DRAFT_642954 [Mycena metata]|uniref:Uncharacterized protein n=1 Tax=Mycena metata TaxID=1033252 RepID=A0AAD7NFL5_9AGAR|nr:hypothetical protein B0H16DRAFT_642954 [Mycena metata]
MTEYDFSEEAYKRHYETQARISKWTQNTTRVPPADPFTPATPMSPNVVPLPDSSKHRRSRSSDPNKEEKHRKSSRSRSRKRSPSPPPPLPTERSRSMGPPRPRTAPPRGDVQQPGLPGPSPFYLAPVQPPVNYTYAPGYHPPPPLPSPHHNRSRSSVATLPPAPPLGTRMRSYSGAPPPPIRSDTYPYASGNKGYMYHMPPTTPPGYVYGPTPIPPPRQASSPHLPAPRPMYGVPPPVYEPAPKQVPLLKRVFGLGGKNRERSHSSASRDGKGWKW